MVYKLIITVDEEEITELRVVEWHKQEGDAIAAGDLFLELETDKSVVEVRMRKPGLLRKIIVAEGDWNTVGEPLCVFSDSGDEAIPDDVSGLPALDVDLEVA